MATRNVVPRGNEEGSLGTVLKRWLSGFFQWLDVKRYIKFTAFDLERTTDNLYKIYLDPEFGLLNYHISTDMSVRIGEKSTIKVYNQTGSKLYKGQVVYVSGAFSNEYNYSTVALAKADDISTFRAIGIVNTEMENGESGFVCLSGIVRNLDLTAFNEGDTVYLSDTVAGGLTKSEPSLLLRIGYVIAPGTGSNGKLLILLQEYGES